MHILITLESLDSHGGVEIQSLLVSKELVRRGHTIEILFIEDGELRSDYEELGSVTQVPTFSFSRKHAVSDLRRLGPMFRSVMRARPDVVYLQRAKEVVAGFIGSRLARAPLVVHLHGVRSNRAALLADRFGVRYMAVSRFVRDAWTEAGLNPDRVEVVYNGVDPQDYPFGGLAERDRARTALGLPLNGFVALYYGRLDTEKGVSVLLNAWGRFGIQPDVGRLLIVGSAVLELQGERFENHLKEVAPPGCHWLPMQRDVIDPLHAADVVVVPSMVNEALPRCVLEAMATGRPVIAANVGGIPEILEGGFENLLFTRGDAAGLATRLAALVDWRHSDPGLGHRASEHIHEHFPARAMYDAIEHRLLAAVDGR